MHLARAHRHTPPPRFAAFVFCCALASSAPAQSPLTAPNASTETLIREAQRHRDAGETVQAEELLRQALGASPQSIPANNALGTLLLDRRLWPDAMDRFETVLRLDPHNAEARAGEEKSAVALALHDRASGDAAACLNTLERATSQLPGDALLLTDLGIQAQSMGRLKTARTALQAALSAAPDNPTARYALARVNLDLQDFPAAERDFQAYLQQRPNDATAHYGLGRVYQMQQRADAATAEFQRSIQLLPTQSESYYQLGQMALDANRDDEASADFQKVVTRAPSHGGALTGLGILQYRAKHYDDAEGLLSRATAAAPDYQPAHYYLGLTLRRLGRAADADRELRVATELIARQQDKSAPVAAP